MTLKSILIQIWKWLEKKASNSPRSGQDFGHMIDIYREYGFPHKRNKQNNP